MDTKALNIGALTRKYAIYLVLVLLVVFLSFQTPAFLTATNIINIFIAESAKGLIAFGVAFVIITKGIDISTGSIVALASVASASLVQNLTYEHKIFPSLGYIPVPVAILAGVLCGVAFGIFNGSLVAYTKIPAFIATLGSQVIARGVAFVYTNAYPVPQLRPDFKALGQGTLFDIPYMIYVFLIVAVLAWILLNYTSFGKSIYAIGANENAARVAGINVELVLVLTYVWCGVLAAIAGILITARAGSGIASLGTGYELDAIAAATVGGCSHSGGIGKISGIMAGILILGVINNGLLLMGVSPYAQQIIKGLIIVVAVIFDMRSSKH